MNEYRTCRDCGETKEATKGLWVTLHNKPIGQRCLQCIALRSKQHRTLSSTKAYHKEYSRAYNKRRRQADPVFRLTSNLRCLLNAHMAYKGWSKTTKTQVLVGCSFEELLSHLRKSFPEWETYEGQLHIDHIKPCATAKTPEELEQLFHYTNLQWLPAAKNLQKSSKYERL